MGLTSTTTTEPANYSWWDYIKHAGKVGLNLLDPFGLVVPSLFDPSDNRTIAQRGMDSAKAIGKSSGEAVGGTVSSFFGELVTTEVLVGGAVLLVLVLVFK